MTGSFRSLGLALAALCLTAPVALSQDVQTTFNEGVDLLERGRNDEALRKFQQVLSMNPTSEQAYELWKSTRSEVWLEMLSEKGDLALVARRMMGLVDTARAERKNDAAAIQKLIGDLRTDDVLARRAAIRQLSADHGEYAVPYLLGWLGDTSNQEARETAIQALQEMNTDVVLPLVEVLNSDDAFLRRNAALVLKNVRDARSIGALAVLAKNDADGAARSVATEAVNAAGKGADPCRELCRLGEAYHMRSTEVLADYQWSDVVWNWTDGKLVSTPTPRALYPDELSKKSYLLALAADPACADAQAGLARAYAGQIAAVETLAAAGTDVAAWKDSVDGSHVALALTGPAALDAALSKSLQQNDSTTSVVLLRTLAEEAHAPTAAMQNALRSNDGAIRSEAAVALGHMAIWGKTRATPDMISALGHVAGREVVRLGYVIDSDAARAAQIADALTKAGLSVGTANNGVVGLMTLRRMPGVDAIVISDTLPDLTSHQVIDEIRDEPALAKAPIFLSSAAPDTAGEAFGDKINGVLANPQDVSAITAAMAQSMGADRERADALARQASEALMTLAGTGTDVSSASDALASSLNRTDGVAVPAAYALAAAGRGDHVGALVAVIGDNARSEPVREAAGRALASIFGRGAPAGEAAKTLHDVARSDAPAAVRRAAAQALGNIPMSAEDRANQLRDAGSSKKAQE